MKTEKEKKGLVRGIRMVEQVLARSMTRGQRSKKMEGRGGIELLELEVDTLSHILDNLQVDLQYS
jgi:hypothetical protein